MKANANLYRLVQDSLVLIAFADSESLKRRDVAEDTGQILKLVQDSLALIAIANSQSLKRRNVDEDWCQILYANSRTIGTNRICEQRIPKNEGMWMKAQA